MNKLAFVFAGQGSQYQGMGLDFKEVNPHLATFEENANHILGYQTQDILSSESDKINQTEYTQPLVLLSSIYALETLKQLDIEPSGVLGFSLGEYTALYAANIFSFHDMMELVKTRARFMQEAAQTNQGAMAAILGLTADDVISLCDELGEGIYPANFNSPVQVVISGTEDKVLKAMELAKTKGAKRAIKLNVSGAFHSPLMSIAGNRFEAFIKPFDANKPRYEIYLNTTAQPLNEQELKTEMVKQITSPVRFVEAILNMKDSGYTHFLEIGPGTVLSGLIKKIDGNLEVAHLERASDLDTVKGWLIDHGFKK